MRSSTTPLSTSLPGHLVRTLIAFAVLASPDVRAQVSGSTYPSVRLQPGTPGTQQSGHANIGGTLLSGAVRTDGFQLGASTTPGYVLTADASGTGDWAPPTGFALPFSGSAASASPLFAVGNTGTGPAIHGQNALTGQFGLLGSLLGGVYGQGTAYGVRGETSDGGLAVYGFDSTSGNFGLLADSVYGAYAEHASSGNFGYMGSKFFGVYAQNGTNSHVGHLAGPAFGAYGRSLDPTGAGVRGESDSPGGPAYGVFGSSISVSSAAAGVRGRGNGVSGPGLPNAAAVLIDNGAITVAGPLGSRPSETIEVTTPWTPINSCNNILGPPPHFHTIGYSTDRPLVNPLILGGGPNAGSMIMATVETDVPPPAKTSYYVQVHSKVPGSCIFRVTRMGTPDPPSCPFPGEIVYIHYTIINPQNGI